ncbi:alkylbase DNA glycosidase-like protein mag2 isoform X2 [Rhodamnia argentea]|uniref:Alkylbase DNA glycosidase-like protein mag2 isoform X2 n=1 Tax=Rhodamnia argentea TaxID=178133 RepID=A0ABM3GZH3_9MYRT|nr:alkylbase DNA glycosidase-like protein mag2 isoform X2 [Rhodamnia argentea]
MSDQTQTQTQNHTEPQPSHDPASSSSAAATTPEVINAPPLQSASPPSKIPLRPQKIRKLSPESSTPDPKPSAASASAKSKTANASSSSSSSSAKPSKNRIVTPRALALPRIVARSLSCDGEVEAAIRHLRDVDPLLATLIDHHASPTFDSFLTPFRALTKSILYQQLAYKAGTSIYTRFIALCGDEAGVLPETVLALDPHQLRQIGVSARKASYLHDLARKYQNGILSDSAIVNMDDKSLFTMLTMVNGIGSWSVHIFMIFSLHRPDVLPINDLGVRKGVQLLYGLKELPRPSQMDQMCEKWRPYRSVASWYLWRFVESKGAPSSAAAVAAGASLQQQQQQQQQQVEEQQQHHPQQPQLLDPINSILNLGYNAFHFSS